MSAVNNLALIGMAFFFAFQSPSSNVQTSAFNHFPALLLCAILISAVFACVFHATVKERIVAAIRYFVILVVVSVAIGWLMLPFSH
ncbi:MAG TPA: hypothetical protein VGR93_02310 [Candidatus Acidoferrales bacterium]|nr:hypothetical protein [Candidatus Acidoferrales bacterium]